MEVEQSRVVVGVPATKVLSEGGEWMTPQRKGDASGDQRLYVAENIGVSFNRVERPALLLTEPAGPIGG